MVNLDSKIWAKQIYHEPKIAIYQLIVVLSLVHLVIWLEILRERWQLHLERNLDEGRNVIRVWISWMMLMMKWKIWSLKLSELLWEGLRREKWNITRLLTVLKREEKEVAVQFHLFDQCSVQREERLIKSKIKEQNRCLAKKKDHSRFQRNDEQSNPEKWEAPQI